MTKKQEKQISDTVRIIKPFGILLKGLIILKSMISTTLCHILRPGFDNYYKSVSGTFFYRFFMSNAKIRIFYLSLLTEE